MQCIVLILCNSSVGQNFSLEVLDWSELKRLVRAKKYPDVAVKYRHSFPEYKSRKIEQEVVTSRNVREISSSLISVSQNETVRPTILNQ